MLVVVEWVPRFLSTPTPHCPPLHVNKFVIPYNLFFNYYYASMIALEFLLLVSRMGCSLFFQVSCCGRFKYVFISHFAGNYFMWNESWSCDHWTLSFTTGSMHATKNVPCNCHSSMNMTSNVAHYKDFLEFDWSGFCANTCWGKYRSIVIITSPKSCVFDHLAQLLKSLPTICL